MLFGKTSIYRRQQMQREFRIGYFVEALILDQFLRSLTQNSTNLSSAIAKIESQNTLHHPLKPQQLTAMPSKCRVHSNSSKISKSLNKLNTLSKKRKIIAIDIEEPVVKKDYLSNDVPYVLENIENDG